MARSPTFREIEAFSAVMQSGTTTSAAMMLNTTQPSISRRLAELSNATELTLFEHAHGRLRPTAEGRLLYKTVQQHFAALKSVDAIAAIMRKSGAGSLRIGCTPTLGIGLLPSVIERYLRRFPDTHINLQTLGTPQLAEYLRQEAFDLVLTTGALDAREFRPKIIARANVVGVLPIGHRLAAVRRVDPARLRGERVMSLSDSEESTLRIRQLFRETCDMGGFSIESNSSITICGLVAAGNGVGIVNPYVASTFAGSLVIKPFVPAVEIAVQMAIPLQTAPSLLARHFISMLASHVARL